MEKKTMKLEKLWTAVLSLIVVCFSSYSIAKSQDDGY